MDPCLRSALFFTFPTGVRDRDDDEDGVGEGVAARLPELLLPPVPLVLVTGLAPIGKRRFLSSSSERDSRVEGAEGIAMEGPDFRVKRAGRARRKGSIESYVAVVSKTVPVEVIP